MPQHGVISIRGARTHNLKNISLDIPRQAFVVITGVSGSGKSSLAFDTLYAEGQRRYVDSLSSYARQFLQVVDKPDVDSIEGLSPAISIDQKTKSTNPRSTVGTVTEIYDYLRLLFARIGIPYSPATGLPIEAQSVDQMADRIAQFAPNTKFYLLAPVIRERKGEYKKELQLYKKQGFQRILVDGTVYALDSVPPLEKNDKHVLALVVDRLVVPPAPSAMPAWMTRLRASLETALKVSNGLVWIQKNDELSKDPLVFSEKFACPVSGFALEEIEPRLFSFNNPQGACPQCNGLGVENTFDTHLVVNWSLSIQQGAVTSLTSGTASVYRLPHVRNYYQQLLETLAKQFKFSALVPFKDLPEKARQIIFYGTGETPVPLTLHTNRKEFHFHKPFEGVIPILMRRYKEANSESVLEMLAPLMKVTECSVCHGTRLKPEALCVKILGLTIADVTRFSVGQALQWFETLLEKLTEKQQKIAEKIVQEIVARLHFLKDVGLEYLTLARESTTLSGGESQRIRLASQIGSGLTGVLYVLDEPSIGLHQRDNDRLLQTLRHLRDLQNTVVVVEHDEDAIRAADWVVDIGPGAGIYGGKLVAQGAPSALINSQESLTAAYLSGRKAIDVPAQRRPVDRHSESLPQKVSRLTCPSKRQQEAWRGSDANPKEWGRVPWLRLKGLRLNNLKNIDVDVPVGRFVCVTGVSGSGKSSFVEGCLVPSLTAALDREPLDTTLCSNIEGSEAIDKIINIDQSHIGRTPRSNPATYIGCFAAIRDWFAHLPEAQARGYSPGRFSFNVKGGRCEACQGDGVLKIEMHFLSDVYVECDQCHGQRYNQETLAVRYKGKNIADVLNMSIDEAVTFFENNTAIWSRLKKLQEVGLGYLSVGHPATLLSGGEAQRIKLAKELCRKATGRTLYVLDEPTTGLHFEDIRKLIELLNQLVDQGNSMIIIEHNLDIIKVADWIIDLGPEGGDGGGQVVATGTPEEVAKDPRSYTGQYLKKMLRPSRLKRSKRP